MLNKLKQYLMYFGLGMFFLLPGISLASSVVVLGGPSPNPVAVGQTSVLSVQVIGITPSGTVTFTDGATVLESQIVPPNGVVSISLVLTTPGLHTITARYLGDASNAPCEVNIAVTAIDRAVSTTTVLPGYPAPNPVTVGMTSTLAVQVSGNAPIGTVVFNDGATVLGMQTLSANGVASMGLVLTTPGVHTITAQYLGDASNLPSSVNVPVTAVDRTVSTTTVLPGYPSPNPVKVGKISVLSVQVSGNLPTGTVTFNDGATVLGSQTLSVNGMASVDLVLTTAGAHTITAQYLGDASNLPSSVNVPMTIVDQVVSTTTVLPGYPSVNPVTVGKTSTLSVLVTGNAPTGTVLFNDGATILGTQTLSANRVASIELVLSTPGVHTITAQYLGDASNLPSSVNASVTALDRSVSTTTVLPGYPSPNPVAAGKTSELSVQVTGNVPMGTVIFNENAIVLGTRTLAVNGVASMDLALTPGVHTITAQYLGDASNLPSLVNVQVTVNPVPPSISCSLTASASTIAPGEASMLTANCSPTPTSYTWINTGFSSSASSGTVTPGSTSIYSVVGNNALGSSSPALAAVIVGTEAVSQTDVRTYVPAAAASTGYVSYLRVINTGSVATPVSVAVIDGSTGAVGVSSQLTPSLAASGAVTFSAQQVETALGISLPASDRSRIRVTGAISPVETQSFLLQPGGAFNEVSAAQSGTSVTVNTYVPAAAASSGYTSYLRVINTGATATAVTVARIDPATGLTGSAGTLNASLPAGAAITYTTAQVETALGVSIAAAERPRIVVSASGSTIEVQSFLIQPGGAFTNVSTEQSGSSIDVRSYVPAASSGYTSFLRVINDSGPATAITASLMDDATGLSLASGTLIASLPANAATTLSSAQVEAALGTSISAASRPRIRVSSIAGANLRTQSFLLQPGGAYNEISNGLTGSSVNVRTYVPAADAASGYTSYLRVINPTADTTAVTIALIDGTTGAVGSPHTLIASLPGGGAQTFSSGQIETVLGATISAGSRPRIQVSGSVTLEVQSFLTQPGGAFTEVSGDQ